MDERVAARIFICSLVLYIVLYGVFVTGGFQLDWPNIYILIIFIPILLIDCLKTAVESFLPRNFLKGKEESSKITTIIPTRDGADTLAATLEDLLKRFKPERIIVSSNGSTDATDDIARKYGVTLFSTEEPIGKVEAINRALPLVETEYTLILDDDVLIGNAVMPTDPLGDTYAGVAFRVLPKPGNWVTSMQLHEYRKSMDIGKGFHNMFATVQNISGAIGLFKTAELIRQVPLHTGEFSGEDLQRTLLIHLSDESRGVVITDSLVETDVPNTLLDLYHQRISGWSPGLFANIGNYLKIMVKKRTPFALRYDAFYNVFLVAALDPLRCIALPIIFFYPVITVLFYITYILLESIPYFVLKAREPLWVVLLFPFFGIFNFVTRMTALVVFIYRRFAVFLARSRALDDYRYTKTRYRVASIFLSTMLIWIVLTLALVSTKYATAQKIFTGLNEVTVHLQK